LSRVINLFFWLATCCRYDEVSLQPQVMMFHGESSCCLGCCLRRRLLGWCGQAKQEHVGVVADGTQTSSVDHTSADHSWTMTPYWRNDALRPLLPLHFQINTIFLNNRCRFLS